MVSYCIIIFHTYNTENNLSVYTSWAGLLTNWHLELASMSNDKILNNNTKLDDSTGKSVIVLSIDLWKSCKKITCTNTLSDGRT